ncbi:flagellar basal-body rod protein FlgG [Paucidesulfovibrio gracilis DSM 16080]|uniref:Flagellar basal-body rod protein FlgG n=1 Tax=Paucidesulfovibrio gracilis DSM 16080 TaxID=1121449 RepID=A0A1T4XBH4_9BACT|nr:flagellar basal-body rod protein FlgF [Paucidesulfovibrio gracilis]SKA86525.1 flagellar basal-body rod protein FlgG [Paucidesulfovibrio gracilis DSM 16080]
MRDSMMNAMFGAMSNEIRMNQIANNLANVNTTAYKKDKVAFHDTFLRFAHDYMVDARPSLRDKDMWPKADLFAKPRLSDQKTDFTQGALQTTGNPLDLALVGDGFFRVRTPDGDYLTRNGSFRLNSEGTLITEQGFEVLGTGGPLSIPPEARNVTVDGSGQVRADDQVVGVLELVDVDDKRQLQKIGNNLYQIDPNGTAAEIPPEDLSVEQGFLERANVEVVTEMVDMIETQRAHQMYTKMMQGTSQIDQKLITRVGRTSA